MHVKYAAGVIAEQLGISKTSLQHYIHILEENGYEVSRNSRMHRQFSDKDIMLLRAFLTLYKKHGYKLKDAAETVMQPNFELPNEVLLHSPQIMPADVHLAQFEDISNSMQLMASHIYGIEQQNTQLLTLIEEQRTQNELLLEQNQTLKQQLGAMMQHIMEQTNATSPNHQRQLDRVEQQNNAIMNTLNRINFSQYEAQQEVALDKSNSEGSKKSGLLAKLFK